MEFEKLQRIISEVLNIDADKITMDSTFIDDLGADSLDVFQIIMGIEEEFDIEIPEDAAESINTVSDAVEQLSQLLINNHKKFLLYEAVAYRQPHSFLLHKKQYRNEVTICI